MNVTTSNPNRLPSNPPWRPHSLGRPRSPAFRRSHIFASVSVSRKVSRSHRDWRRALAVPTEGGCMAARANLQTFRDNATEIAPLLAAIPSRNLHIRFSCEKLSLICHLIFSTFFKRKKRYSYNILTIDSEVFARTPQRDISTENRKGSKPAEDTKITPLVVGRASLPSAFARARAVPFRWERQAVTSFRFRSSIPVMRHLMQAPLQPSPKPPSVMGILGTLRAVPATAFPGSC